VGESRTFVGAFTERITGAAFHDVPSIRDMVISAMIRGPNRLT
jgi:hypothetical protein